MNADLADRMNEFQRCVEQRDRPGAEDILDAEFALVLVQPTLAVMPRQRWLEVLDDYVVHSYDVREQTVDVDRDCGAVLHQVVMNATVLGQDRSGVFVLSDIWRLRDGRWRLWRRHSTPLSAGGMPGA